MNNIAGGRVVLPQKRWECREEEEQQKSADDETDERNSLKLGNPGHGTFIKVGKFRLVGNGTFLKVCVVEMVCTSV